MNERKSGERYPSNEIQSPLGRGIFDLIYHGCFTVVGGVVSHEIADAVTDSANAHTISTVAGAAAGLALSAVLKRFSH